MKVSGIVCEFDPFHNGHKYLMEKTRQNGATHIVTVMSGNFVQRGNPAVIGKFRRAELAVMSGADLVIELPVRFCLAPAEEFAKAAIYLLGSLGVVDEIAFGSECGDVRTLRQTAEILKNCRDIPQIAELTKKGMTYPKALSEYFAEEMPETAHILLKPNNILGIEYIKALENFGFDQDIFTVKRMGAPHGSEIPTGNTASASYIRSHPDSCRGLLPDIWADELERGTADISRLERVILHRIRTLTLEEAEKAVDSSSGLAQRICNARMAASLDELYSSVKTKGYTMARIRRTILRLLIGISDSDMKIMPPYIRVLAFNSRGREILSQAKEKAKLPFDTSLSRLSGINENARIFAESEAIAGDIHALAFDEIKPAGTEYTQKIKLTSCS